MPRKPSKKKTFDLTTIEKNVGSLTLIVKKLYL